MATFSLPEELTRPTVEALSADTGVTYDCAAVRRADGGCRERKYVRRPFPQSAFLKIAHGKRRAVHRRRAQNTAQCEAFPESGGVQVFI